MKNDVNFLRNVPINSYKKFEKVMKLWNREILKNYIKILKNYMKNSEKNFHQSSIDFYTSLLIKDYALYVYVMIFIWD